MPNRIFFLLHLSYSPIASFFVLCNLGSGSKCVQTDGGCGERWEGEGWIKMDLFVKEKQQQGWRGEGWLNVGLFLFSP